MSKTYKLDNLSEEIRNQILNYKFLRWDEEQIFLRLEEIHDLVLDEKPYLTKEMLSIMLKVNPQSIRKYFNGNQLPSNDMLLNFADIFEEDVSYLLGLTDVSLVKNRKNAAIRQRKDI